MKKISLTTWILIALIAGVIFGVVWPEGARSMRLLGTIFLRLIKSVIAPMAFATLVVGIAGTGNIKTVGRIGGKALLYFEIVTTLALFVGLAAVHITKPGVGVSLPTSAQVDVSKSGPDFAQVLEHTFPTSIFDAMARGEVLQIVVFALLFGMACAAIGSTAKPVLDFCEALAQIMFKYTGYVMYVAPFGVFGAIAATVGDKGLGVLVNLGKLVLTLYGALIFFVIFVLGTVALIIRLPVRRFIQLVREPFMIAFSTTTSEAALPIALQNLPKMGIPRHIVAFVLPAGYSFNLDGSTLYLSLAAIFVAQAAGVNLTLSQQLLMMLTLMLTSKGIAGVPRASLVILAGTLASFNLPVEGVAVILGADELMDMARTSVNLLGNCLAAAVVAKWEGYTFTDAVTEQEPVTTAS